MFGLDFQILLDDRKRLNESIYVKIDNIVQFQNYFGKDLKKLTLNHPKIELLLVLKQSNNNFGFAFDFFFFLFFFLNPPCYVANNNFYFYLFSFDMDFHEL